MIIEHLIGIFSPEHGGPVVSLENYARGQVAAGLSVRLRTIEGYPNVSPAVRLGAPIDQHVFPVGFPVKLGRSRELAQFLRKESSPDIYHLHGAWLRTMYYGYREAKRRNRPYLIQINGSYQPFDLLRKPLRKKVARAWFQDRMLHEAPCLHVNSFKEANEMRQLGFQNPMVVIPAGFNVAQSEEIVRKSEGSGLLPEVSGRPFFLYLARIHPNKGIEVLLHAWHRVESEYPEMLLLIVGSGEPEYVEKFKKLAASLGIEKRCVWKGYTSEAEKAWAYCNARFYCLPSFTENFGNTVQEALGFGTPVLTTDRTPWLELEKLGCGWVTQPETGVMEVILRKAIKTPPNELKAMGRRGKDYIYSDFSLESVVQKQIEAYNWLLGGAKPTRFIFE